MKLFSGYLKYRIKLFVTCAIVTGIFASSYLLFDMPPIAVLYPLILTVVIGLVATGFDFALFVKRHERILSEELLKESFQKSFPRRKTSLKKTIST